MTRWLRLAAALLAAFLVAGPPAFAQRRPQVANGYPDVSTPMADVVVRITGPIPGGGTRVCSGTLVTPMAVLTARHCVNGSEGGGNDGPPIGYPITITIGNDSTAPLRTYTSNNVIPTRTWAPGPQTTPDPGNDVAVIFLDPPGTALPGALPGPAFDYAQIVHPSLASPCPTAGCGDADGGNYAPPLGIVGWAPQDATPKRQIAYQTAFNHYPGKPDDRGQYWQRTQTAVHTDPGDSGGPLFVVRPVPGHPGSYFRDVIGVLSGFAGSNEYWVDITRGAIADWVRNALADPIPRNARWVASHPGLTWIGDVDYTGPCQKNRDADCDHIYDEHDNCPAFYNPDQRDSVGDGVGDACRGPHPPPWSKPTCTARWTCQAFQASVVVSCVFGTQGLELYRRDAAGNFQPVNANTTQDLNAFVDYYAAAAGTALTYDVFQTTPPAWSDPMTVVAGDCTCHPENNCPRDAQCGSAPDGCGGSDSCGGACPAGNQCSSNHCCPHGLVWNSVVQMCAKIAGCRPGFGDCGGFCCRCTGTRCQ